MFDLCPPVGTHELILESIDLNSPLFPFPAVLKKDITTLYVAATRTDQEANNCGTLDFGFVSDPYFEQVGKLSEPFTIDLATEDTLFEFDLGEVIVEATGIKTDPIIEFVKEPR